MSEAEIAKALRTAIKEGDVERVRSLIGGSKERLQQMTPFGTWLHIAAKEGNLELVQCLISIGADINARGGTFAVLLTWRQAMDSYRLCEPCLPKMQSWT